MSRSLTTANADEVVKTSIQVVNLLKLEFAVPVHAHTGFGVITFDGDDYLGVGHFGSIGEARESELIGPGPLTIGLSSIDAGHLLEALNAGNFGDTAILYEAYKADDGTLVDDPWIVWKGWYEFATIRQGAENGIQIQLQNDLAVLDEAVGSRFSDEFQRTRYLDDDGFEFVAEMANVKLVWRGEKVSTGAQGGGGGSGPPGERREYPRQRH